MASQVIFLISSKRIEARVWGEASDKTPVYASDVIVTYQVLPEKSAWIYNEKRIAIKNDCNKRQLQ